MKALNAKQKEFYNSLTKLQRIVVSERIKGSEHYKCYFATGFDGPKADAAKHSIKICSVPEVKAFIDEVIGECPLAEKAIAERKDVLKRLTNMMNANLFDVLDFTYDKDGKPTHVTVKNKQELEMVQQLSVKKIEPGEHGMKVTLHDPIDAMKQLCKMQGYDTPTKKEIKLHKLDEKLRAEVDAELDSEY